MSTSLDRTSIVRGAGIVSFGSQTFWDKGTISAMLETSFNEHRVAGYGKLDDAKADEVVKVTFQPHGELTSGALGVLIPTWLRAPTVDASILGSTDVEAVIHSKAGQKITLHNAILTKPPSLYLGAQRPVWDGSVELTGLVKKSTARTAAASVYTLAATAFSGYAVSRSDVKRLSYTGTWAQTPSVTITAKDGWKVEIVPELVMQKTDDLGTYDITVKTVVIRAKCRPMNLSEALWAYNNVQNSASAAIGASQVSATALTIAADVAGGISLVMNNATLKTPGLKWGEDELRADELGWEAYPTITDGTPGALFTIALTT